MKHGRGARATKWREEPMPKLDLVGAINLALAQEMAADAEAADEDGDDDR